MSRVTHLKLQSTEDETNIPEEEFLGPARELILSILLVSSLELLMERTYTLMLNWIWS